MTEKTSRRRDAIISVLRSTTSHPSADWVYQQVRRELPGIGVATVYRHLRLLRSRGEILELHTREGTVRYDGNTDVHYHFHCDRCGRIMDLDEPVDATLESRVAARTGLMVTRHSLDVSGVCPECLAADARDAAAGSEELQKHGLVVPPGAAL